MHLQAQGDRLGEQVIVRMLKIRGNLNAVKLYEMPRLRPILTVIHWQFDWSAIRHTDHPLK